MVRVLCDTSFLIHLVTRRIKNLSTFEDGIGPVSFVVPSPVLAEIERLGADARTARMMPPVVAYARNLDAVEMDGSFADDAILAYVEERGGIVATMDRELKRRVKERGGSVMSMNNDRIVLE